MATKATMAPCVESGCSPSVTALNGTSSVMVDSYALSACDHDRERHEEVTQHDVHQELPVREAWPSFRSVGTSLRGWACVFSSAAVGTVQGAMHEVGRGTSFVASQLGNTFSHTSTVEQLTSASDRARNIGGLVAERAVAAGGELNDALQLFDSASSSSSTSPLRRRSVSVSDSLLTGLSGLREEAQPILHGIKYTPLSAVEALQGEVSTPDDTREKRATASVLARDCWTLWLQKHEALTRCESLYALLLADSRRTNMLAAELKTVEELLQTLTYSDMEDSTGTNSVELDLDDGRLHPVEASRQEALDECRKLVTARAKEAVDSFKERSRHYPCGRACPTTLQFKIARSDEDIQDVLKSFEVKVAEEMEEALSQATEIILTPDLQTLSHSLARRVDFWEREIEDNWSMWTGNSCHFHEACEGVADTWSKLQETIYEILVWIADEANSPSSQTSPIAFVVPLLDVKDVRQHKIWEELYSVLVEAAAMVVALGAWTDYHNLRGDGVTLQQAREMFEAILYALDIAFEGRFGYKFDGREAVRDRLARNATWNLVVDSETNAGSNCWWAPESWPSRVCPKDSQQAPLIDKDDLSKLAKSDKKRDCYNMLFKKHLSRLSESPPLDDDAVNLLGMHGDVDAEGSVCPIFVGPASIEQAITPEFTEQ